MPTVYLAGPMTGYPRWNFDAFDRYRDFLKSKGWMVISPADLDREIGFDPDTPHVDADFQRAALVRDAEALHRCDAIALMPGWERSKGVAFELAAARFLGLREIDATTGEAIHDGEYWLPDVPIDAELDPDADDYEVERGMPRHANRKDYPIYSGVLRYFPDAIAEVARCSQVGNDQHNPGEPLHWAREKSTDHHDCITRHLMQAGQIDSDGVPHSAKAAWRALAALQVEIEASRDR
jgi:hypothetical protein